MSGHFHILEGNPFQIRELTYEDIDEHGEANLEPYGDGTHTIGFFRQRQQQVKERVRAVRRTGAKSHVFMAFHGP